MSAQGRQACSDTPALQAVEVTNLDVTSGEELGQWQLVVDQGLGERWRSNADRALGNVA